MENLSKYLVDCWDKLLRQYPDAGILICGDFIYLNPDSFSRQFKLSQIVKAPTGKHNILDKIFTYLVVFIQNHLLPILLVSLITLCVIVRPAEYKHKLTEESSNNMTRYRKYDG